MTRAILLLLSSSALVAPVFAADTPVALGEALAKEGYVRTRSDTFKDASGRTTLAGEWTRGASKVGAIQRKSELVVDGVNVRLDAGVVEAGGKLALRKIDYDRTLAPLLAPKPAVARPIRTVVLDAGHGGRDPGKQNFALHLDEKAMTLDVVRRIKSRLEVAGYRVLLTRNTDTYVALEERAKFANRNKADLFVSIHFNADLDAEVTGFETYCLTPAGCISTNDDRNGGFDTSAVHGNRNDDANIRFAYLVQKSLKSLLDSPDRGVRRARFAVLRDLDCPGVLIESAFLSNEGESKKIANPVFREARVAKAVVEAVEACRASLPYPADQ